MIILYTNTRIINVIILIIVIIIKFYIWTKRKGENQILQYFMAYFTSWKNDQTKFILAIYSCNVSTYLRVVIHYPIAPCLTSLSLARFINRPKSWELSLPISFVFLFSSFLFCTQYIQNFMLFGFASLHIVLIFYVI